MKHLLVAALAATLVAEGRAADQIAQASGDWNAITWSPGALPAAADIVHIEGGFTVNYTAGASPNFSRVYVGDNTGGFQVADGVLEILGGMLTVNANAAGAFIVGRADNSTGTLNITDGIMRGVGAGNGAGLQIGYGANSTGSVTVSGGELQLAGGVVIGSGDNSTGHFTVTGGTVTVASNIDGGSFQVGGRLPGSNTATYLQTDGTVTIVHSSFRVGYAGAVNQQIDASAKITGGSFSGNVQVGRQSSLRIGGGDGGKLTIGAQAEISGRDRAWEVSGNGEIIFALGPNDAFQAVDLTGVAVENALVFSQEGARVTVDGTALVFSNTYKPITLVRFADGKGPSATSTNFVVFDFTGFDKRFTPRLAWTGTSLELKVLR